jgi:sec-independent protein translocase protein TatC
MANRQDEDDLFKHTSMTFGEHLEELRASLFKAVLSLAVGFCIGLYFAPTIVQWIQSPLESALTTYYSTEAIEYINEHVPASLRDDEAVRKLVFEEGMVPRETYIAPADLLRELKQKYPGKFDQIELNAPATPASQSAATATDTAQPPAAGAAQPSSTRFTKTDLIPLLLWTKLSEDDRVRLKAMNVQESFMIYIKAAFLFGAIVSSPAVFWFLWSFVAAGLYPHEKHYVHTFLPISLGLFACGAALAFTAVFPPVLAFFFSITKSMGQELEPRISEWMGFVLLLPLGFGISFQLPLVMLFLERIHIFNVQTYLSKWRIAVLLMAIMSMVLSPGGDPYSMMMMLVPLIGLYFGGIGLCKWLPGTPAQTSVATRDGTD